jgi:hypothetical protein
MRPLQCFFYLAVAMSFMLNTWQNTSRAQRFLVLAAANLQERIGAMRRLISFLHFSSRRGLSGILETLIDGLW